MRDGKRDVSTQVETDPRWIYRSASTRTLVLLPPNNRYPRSRKLPCVNPIDILFGRLESKHVRATDADRRGRVSLYLTGAPHGRGEPFRLIQ